MQVICNQQHLPNIAATTRVARDSRLIANVSRRLRRIARVTYNVIITTVM